MLTSSEFTVIVIGQHVEVCTTQAWEFERASKDLDYFLFRIGVLSPITARLRRVKKPRA